MTFVRSRRRRGCGDRGAAAVEFALVTPVLFLLLFGIIDYGLWFADSISARQAIRNSARQGSIGQFGACPGSVSNPLQNLACTVNSSMDQIGSSTVVRVTVAQTPTSAGGEAWTQGYTLRVCALSKHQALLPLVPFPNNGLSSTRVDIPIEIASLPGTVATYADPVPAGWSLPNPWSSWCP